MAERVITSLRFAGDWPWWSGVALASALAGLICWLYQPEVRHLARGLRWGLPALRAGSVAMVALILSGPVLHHRRVIGELARLLLLVDESRSMGLSDPAMDLGRKLRILQEMKLIAPGTLKMDLPEAGEALGEAMALAEKANASLNVESSEWNRLLTDFAALLETAQAHLSPGGLPPERSEAFRQELLDPAHEVARREMRQLEDRQRAAQDLTRLAAVAERWARECALVFQRGLQGPMGGGSAEVQQALKQFDTMPRWQRLQQLLLAGEGGSLLEKLAGTHEVELVALEGGTVHPLWKTGAGAGTEPAELPKPEAAATDLGTPLETLLTPSTGVNQRTAAVLLSDGQHNEGATPLEAARILGARQVPLFTVGFGTTTRPRDLAVLKVEAPDSVFVEDRVRGEITLKDDMVAGLPFKLTIKDGETVLWEQALFTQGSDLRTVPFEFPVSGPVAQRLKGERPGVQRAGVPVEVQVAVSSVEGDLEPANNQAELRVRAVTQRRKILLLDGRPRWETRYLRNLFERDEQWEVNAVVAGEMAGEAGLARGNAPERFPTDLALLAGYDLILFGEVPPALFKPEELQAIRDFVEKRGGALAFIDGPRGRLRAYADTALAPLFPVDFQRAKPSFNAARLSLRDAALTLAPFALVADRTLNAGVWRNLPAPHWLSGAVALPGAEVLVEAELPGTKAPAVVSRNFGAGHVLYQAFEDSWRWRYEAADLYHVRYWNQIADWIAELPFAARDRFISLDAGAITYRPSDTAELRVRLRDGEGRPVTNAVVDAVLHRDGLPVATIRLGADESAGGLFRGHTAPLEAGAYEVTVESAAIAEQEAKARTSFKVEPRATGELAQLSLNEELLRQMSILTGGQYWREENIGRLLEALAPFSQGRVVESETILWQSYWWFLPIILLLTIEWLLRKRAGLI